MLRYDLWELCRNGPEADLGATERTQPAMLAAGVATWRVWRAHGGPRPAAMAGHSLGEYTALVCSNALDFRVAVDLVRFRGQVMQAAVPRDKGAMAAILGLDDAEIEAACREAAQGEVVEAVNFNAPGQVVVAGLKTAVAACDRGREGARRQARCAAAGERALAQQPDAGRGGEACRNGSRRRPLRMPDVADVYTVGVRTHESEEGIRRALKEQLFSPVRWADTVRAMIAKGATTLIECGPGKVLTTLNRRVERRADLTMLAVDDPATLEAALAACREKGNV